MPFKRLIRIAIFTFIILALFFLIPQGPVQVTSPKRAIMGTFASITVLVPEEAIAQKAITNAFDRLDEIEKKMSLTIVGSELNTINSTAASEPMKMSDDTFYVIKKSVEFSRQTEGAFDITVGPIIDLWKNAADSNSLPTQQQINYAKEISGYEKLILGPSKKTVGFKKEGMKIDLGGIAKGYAIDQAVKALQDAGVKAGLVNIGGDIRCFGKPVSKDNWLIALQNPDIESPNKLLLKLKLNDKAIATSGHYNRHYDLQGQLQSHIIDSVTAKGADKLASVTVIADDAITADAIATAIHVMGKEKGLKLTDYLNQKGMDIDVILISPAPDFEITSSENANKYIAD